MDRHAIELEAEYRGLPITFRATRLGDDLLVVLAGGEKPHIGSVVLAEAQPSSADDSHRSVTSQVLNRPPHKEEAVARPAAEVLAGRLGVPVLVVSGIHYQGLNAEGVEAVKAICRELVERYLSAVAPG